MERHVREVICRPPTWVNWVDVNEGDEHLSVLRSRLMTQKNEACVYARAARRDIRVRRSASAGGN